MKSPATRPFLTVLTAAIEPAPRRLYQGVRSSLRPFVKPGVPLPAVSPYPGHSALTRSVVEGLRAIGADFNYNPRSVGQLASVVYAPANEALRQAAALKARGAIDVLVAGPVNGLSPLDGGGALLTPQVDWWIVPSEWVVSLYEREVPQVVSKLRVCPCGVDTEYWRPSTVARTNRTIVYWKSGDERFCADVERRIAAQGLDPVRIRYGAYDREAFRQLLDGAAFGVFLSSFETQGLALAEAWSMDVPTLVWDPRERTEWCGWSFDSGSSAPYLTPATGLSWRGVEEFDSVLSEAQQRRDFAPRQWVSENMTDAICARRLFQIIRESAADRVAI